MTKKPAKKAASRTKLPPGARTVTESMLLDLQRAIEGKNFGTLEDLKAFMGSPSGQGLMESLDNEELAAKDEAQELAFEAMEAESEAEARKLAQRALAKDPDCVDALVVLTDIEARSTREIIERLQKAVAAGERSLGAAFIRENKGHFWSIIETRPYMRALERLAGMLRSQGIHLDAIRHYEHLLELNPNDNQGVRDPLLGLYLAAGDLKKAGVLLKKYKNDASANFAWCRALERFLAGDLTAAEAALRTARNENSFVELYMSGKKALPKSLPEMYSPGSEEEAILCLDSMSAAWAAHQNAVSWLAEQGVLVPIQDKRQGKRRTVGKNKP
jgi:tetratricopeptide (TPR) repeat protein